jgi:heme-degrading monooxygenase HmoA
MYVVVWSFRVRPERIRHFERIYGAEGDWAQLFSRSPGFIRTDLWRDPNVVGSYFTADYWRDPQDYDQLLRAHVGDYTRLDQESEALTLSEERIGGYELVLKRH